jgi:putative transposase
MTPAVSRRRRVPRDEELRTLILALAPTQPRYGFRRIHLLVTREHGLRVNLKAVRRIWREEGLRLKRRTVKRRVGRSTNPHPVAAVPGQGWCYDFVHERLANGRQARILVVLDECSRRCLALIAAPSFRATRVAKELDWLFLVHGAPSYIRSDNGSEFVAGAVQRKLESKGVATKFIEPGKPWQNGKVESFNDKLRDEFLNCDIFESGNELQAGLDAFLDQYNNFRPHSSLGYLTPAEFELKFASEQDQTEAILSA